MGRFQIFTTWNLFSYCSVFWNCKSRTHVDGQPKGWVRGWGCDKELTSVSPGIFPMYNVGGHTNVRMVEREWKGTKETMSAHNKDPFWPFQLSRVMKSVVCVTCHYTPTHTGKQPARVSMCWINNPCRLEHSLEYEHSYRFLFWSKYFTFPIYSIFYLSNHCVFFTDGPVTQLNTYADDIHHCCMHAMLSLGNQPLHQHSIVGYPREVCWECQHWGICKGVPTFFRSAHHYIFFTSLVPFGDSWCLLAECDSWWVTHTEKRHVFVALGIKN